MKKGPVSKTAMATRTTTVPAIGGSQSNYRNGAQGFIRWVEENVCMKIYPKGSTSAVYIPMGIVAKGQVFQGYDTTAYKRLWDEQKAIVRQALVMENGRFKYRLLVFCWMRGEGKSVIACLLQLWKFFCFSKQMIVLGANSKDQTKFVHYDVMTEIILNSPKLLARVGEKNIQTNEIRLRDSRGYTMSTIRAISAFSGIVSNITGYTFSEMFDMKNPKYFVQLDGSIRNIPNAFGVIDSTVSAKQHILYKLFESCSKGEDKLTYFSYRSSPRGDLSDYWNPNQTVEQLASYKSKFPFGEFERYFQNLWSAGTERVFTPEMIEATKYIGLDGVIGKYQGIVEVLEKQTALLENIEKLTRRLPVDAIKKDNASTMAGLQSRLWSIDKECSMKGSGGLVKPISAFDLIRLGDLFNTDWVILTGLDRADPMKEKTGARTMLCAVAKGFPGSRTDPDLLRNMGPEQGVPFYLYIVVYLNIIGDHSAETIKSELLNIQSEYEGIDMFTSERWGAWDFPAWCEEHGIPSELVYPTYDRQKIAFFELFIACRDGRFKSPTVPVAGHKMDNILYEEMSVFDHNPDPPRWFGSPEKKEKYGIQDDAIYSLGWCIFGGRELGIDNFRQIKGSVFFGDYFENKALAGRY